MRSAAATLGARGNGVRGDVRREVDAQAMVDEAVRFGEAGGGTGLDVLVNSAAGNFLAAAETLSPNGFRTVMVRARAL